ncbi:MAG: hypothetical protein WA820_27405, partial [Bradyrhizobium sp.]
MQAFQQIFGQKYVVARKQNRGEIGERTGRGCRKWLRLLQGIHGPHLRARVIGRDCKFPIAIHQQNFADEGHRRVPL